MLYPDIAYITSFDGPAINMGVHGFMLRQLQATTFSQLYQSCDNVVRLLGSFPNLLRDNPIGKISWPPTLNWQENIPQHIIWSAQYGDVQTAWPPLIKRVARLSRGCGADAHKSILLWYFVQQISTHIRHFGLWSGDMFWIYQSVGAEPILWLQWIVPGILGIWPWLLLILITSVHKLFLGR